MRLPDARWNEPADVHEEPSFCGPLRTDVVLPCNAEGALAAAEAYSAAFDKWLGWKRVALDRAEQQRMRDPSDLSASVGSCKVSGAASQRRAVAAYAHDSISRALRYAMAVDDAERKEGRSLMMSRNIAMARALHPSVAGMSGVLQLRRCGVGGRLAMAEAGPADSVNYYVEEMVYASTDVNAPMPSDAERTLRVLEADRAGAVGPGANI